MVSKAEELKGSILKLEGTKYTMESQRSFDSKTCLHDVKLDDTSTTTTAIAPAAAANRS
jgi:hypothetical protein